MMSKTDLSRLVYSTEHGKMCPICSKTLVHCICQKNERSGTGDGIVRVHWETKGRKGKGVTVITGIPLKSEALKEFSKTLKKKCGSGGTVKKNVLEIQGDHRTRCISALKKEGWQVKGSGG